MADNYLCTLWPVVFVVRMFWIGGNISLSHGLTNISCFFLTILVTMICQVQTTAIRWKHEKKCWIK